MSNEQGRQAVDGYVTLKAPCRVCGRGAGVKGGVLTRVEAVESMMPGDEPLSAGAQKRVHFVAAHS